MVVNNWNDCQYILALARCRTLKATAEHLGVNQTTVSRRIKQINDRVGAQLFIRSPEGYGLTPKGEAMLSVLQKVEREIEIAYDTVEQEDFDVTGRVKITSVPVVIDYLLTPNCEPLLDEYPGLTLDMVSDSVNYSLTHREADIALRFARPKSDHTALAQRVGTIEFGLFVHRGLVDDKKLPWILYGEERQGLPQNQFMEEKMRQLNERQYPMTYTDLISVEKAVHSGLGKSVMPIFQASANSDLVQIPLEGEALKRELWLMVHADIRQVKKISVVIDWIVASLKPLRQ